MNPYRKILDAVQHEVGVWLSAEDTALLSQDDHIADTANIVDAEEAYSAAASFQWCNDVNYGNVNLGD